jgi:hypothetical protein
MARVVPPVVLNGPPMMLKAPAVAVISYFSFLLLAIFRVLLNLAG